MCFIRACCHKLRVSKPNSQREGENKAKQKKSDALHLLSALSRAPNISGNCTHGAELLALVSGDQAHQGITVRAACLQRGKCRFSCSRGSRAIVQQPNRVLCRAEVNLFFL